MRNDCSINFHLSKLSTVLPNSPYRKMLCLVRDWKRKLKLITVKGITQMGRTVLVMVLVVLHVRCTQSSFCPKLLFHMDCSFFTCCVLTSHFSFSSSPELGTYCGNTRPYPVIFKGRFLRITLSSSNNSPVLRAFVARYSFTFGEQSTVPGMNKRVWNVPWERWQGYSMYSENADRATVCTLRTLTGLQYVPCER